MKLRHWIAIFSFLAAFGLSVLFVGLILPKGCPAGTSHIKNPSPADTETKLQARIRKFLEADRQTGIELANDKVRSSHSNNHWNIEKIATNNLVEKMEKVKCDGLPEDFCNAWEEHVVAWKYKAILLDRYYKNGSLEYQIPNEQISSSYQKMLTAARKYGVDFNY